MSRNNLSFTTIALAWLMAFSASPAQAGFTQNIVSRMPESNIASPMPEPQAPVQPMAVEQPMMMPPSPAYEQPMTMPPSPAYDQPMMAQPAPYQPNDSRAYAMPAESWKPYSGAPDAPPPTSAKKRTVFSDFPSIEQIDKVIDEGFWYSNRLGGGEGAAERSAGTGFGTPSTWETKHKSYSETR